MDDPMSDMTTADTSSAQTDAHVLAALKSAASAEDFFTLLNVPFDPRILRVARLHILKRMGDYLARENVEAAAPQTTAARCKAVLERAYADFVTSSPLQERVFKVLKEAAAPQTPPPPDFVPLDRLAE